MGFLCQCTPHFQFDCKACSVTVELVKATGVVTCSLFFNVKQCAFYSASAFECACSHFMVLRMYIVVLLTLHPVCEICVGMVDMSLSQISIITHTCKNVPFQILCPCD